MKKLNNIDAFEQRMLGIESRLAELEMATSNLEDVALTPPGCAVVPLTIGFKLLGPNGRVPTKGSAGAAGWDLYSATDQELQTGHTYLISSQLALEIPSGWEAQVRPRSRFGHFIDFGTIDSDYRGEILVKVVARYDGYISLGERIAQLVFAPVPNVEYVELAELTPTARGAGGFGSSGR